MTGVMRVSAKELVEQAVHELFDRRDAAAVDRYWSPGYIEHSIVGADGLRGLRDLAGSLPEASTCDARIRVTTRTQPAVPTVVLDDQADLV